MFPFHLCIYVRRTPRRQQTTTATMTATSHFLWYTMHLFRIPFSHIGFFFIKLQICKCMHFSLHIVAVLLSKLSISHSNSGTVHLIAATLCVCVWILYVRRIAECERQVAHTHPMYRRLLFVRSTRKLVLSRRLCICSRFSPFFLPYFRWRRERKKKKFMQK